MSKKDSFINKHGCLTFFILVGLTMLLMAACIAYVKMGIPLVLINPKM